MARLVEIYALLVPHHFPTLTLKCRCTKFDSMTRDMRIAMFHPMCDEALLSAELKHHHNIISIRFILVGGGEFLVMMDLTSESSELQGAVITLDSMLRDREC